MWPGSGKFLLQGSDALDVYFVWGFAQMVGESGMNSGDVPLILRGS